MCNPFHPGQCTHTTRLRYLALVTFRVRLVQIETVENINFAVLESVLLRDALSVAALHAAGMHSEDARAILSLRAHDQSTQPVVRLDLRSETCFWLNDLEKDPAYRYIPARLVHWQYQVA